MHRFAISFASLAALGAVTGCSLELADDEQPDRVEEATSAITTAVGGRRWVVYAPLGGCVDRVGYIAEPLFPPSALLPLQLVEYCLYTWPPGPAPTLADINALQLDVNTTDFAEDSALVVPLAPPGVYSDQLAAFMRDKIKARIGEVTATPSLPSPPPVHVVVLDTAPDSASWAQVTGTNRHGDTVAALIAAIAEAPGAALVSTILAMPRRTEPVGQSVILDTTSGGDFGHLSDLSRALWAAVSAHESLHPLQKLVINLSLGWEPLGPWSECGEELLPAARAVRDVLDHAACQHGALIVAAAGNGTAGPAPASGLMCPAAWTDTGTSCDAQRPLVVAAYGLDYRDRPTALARPHSAVPLAAPGIGGVAWAPTASPPEPLTGTSVSAAAVSATAAVVWAADPTRTPEQVTRRLYDHGVPVGLTADTCTLGLSPCAVRRVSLCNALGAFAGSGWACKSAGDDLGTSNPSFSPAVMSALLAASPTPSGSASHLPAQSPLPTTLATTVGGQAALFPQPTDLTCSKCALQSPINSTNIFYGEMPIGISSPTLVVESATGSSASYALPAVSAGTLFSVTLPTGAPAARAAWVSGTDTTTNLSKQQQIFVTR